MRRDHLLFIAVLAVAAGCTGTSDGTSRGASVGTGDPSVDAGDGPGDDADSAPALDGGAGTAPDAATGGAATENVFVIVMENKSWSSIVGNPAAPYINDTLLPIAAHAEAYGNVPGLHPSEPNYIWLEAGSDQGLTTDGDASSGNSTATTAHLVTLLEAAGVSWKAYEEDMPPGVCPLSSSGLYAAKHDPFVYFRDVTDGNSPASQRCITHVAPMTELQSDLDRGATPRYVFLTPNLCNDMHGDSGCPAGDPVRLGDTWLAATIPAIMRSSVYRAGHAAILVTWDENEGGDAPIGMIVISPHAKAGYAGTVPYSHSSTLRTLEEIFGVAPMLGDAANATSLADLFRDYP